jgi:uncharacterized protein (DUF2236 family)
MWVYATLVDTALAAYELVLPQLGTETRERYYAEARILGVLFGIPLEAQPPNWAAFKRYVEAMLASDTLTVGSAARDIGANVLKGAGRIPVPGWYRDVTVALVPEPLREGFALPFAPREQRRAARTLEAARRTYPMLPDRVRHVPPYQEAVARLTGRAGPDLVTRTLNRLWIGRTSMGG